MAAHADTIAELTPAVGRLLDRHLGLAKEWFPHEFVPWSRGRDFVPGEAGTGRGPDVPDGRAQRAVRQPAHRGQPPVLLQLHRRLVRRRRRVGRVGTPVDRRRRPALDRDPRLPQRDPRCSTRSSSSGPAWPKCAAGRCPQPVGPLDGLVYVALQELATRVAHRNTGKLLDDPAGVDVMNRVAADENLHFLFYRDLVLAALEIDPSAMVCAIERQVRDFEMPGTGIVDFGAHADGHRRTPASTTCWCTTTRCSPRS